MSLAKNIKKFIFISIIALTTTVAAQAAEGTLYDALGGKDAIKVVVDDFVNIVAADARINFQFGNTDIAHLKEMLVDQVCMATGGPCEYRGGDMKTVHVNMNITNAQFNALTECLYSALKNNGVPYSMQNDLIAMLAPMQRDIVTK